MTEGSSSRSESLGTVVIPRGALRISDGFTWSYGRMNIALCPRCLAGQSGATTRCGKAIPPTQVVFALHCEGCDVTFECYVAVRPHPPHQHAMHWAAVVPLPRERYPGTPSFVSDNPTRRKSSSRDHKVPRRTSRYDYNNNDR